MFILHDRMQKGRDAKEARTNLEPLLTTCELAAYRAGRQEMTATMMRMPGG